MVAVDTAACCLSIGWLGQGRQLPFLGRMSGDRVLSQGQGSSIFLTETGGFIALPGCQALFFFLQASVDMPADQRCQQARLPAEFGIDIRQEPACRFPELRMVLVVALHGPGRPGIGGAERCCLPGETVPNTPGMVLVCLPAIQQYPEQAQQAGAVDLEVLAE